MEKLQETAFDEAIAYLSSAKSLNWTKAQRATFICQLEAMDASRGLACLSLDSLQSMVSSMTENISFYPCFPAGEAPLHANPEDLSLHVYAALALYQE
ncbi:hypothetical protein [Photobacterium sanguinicancri]|uniref:hypothetical protein n=1 Tax=Photobacterium sanguinicancri TaxID=875932 RepID=UPI003D0A6BCE